LENFFRVLYPTLGRLFLMGVGPSRTGPSPLQTVLFKRTSLSRNGIWARLLLIPFPHLRPPPSPPPYPLSPPSRALLPTSFLPPPLYSLSYCIFFGGLSRAVCNPFSDSSRRLGTLGLFHVLHWIPFPGRRTPVNKNSIYPPWVTQDGSVSPPLDPDYP